MSTSMLLGIFSWIGDFFKSMFDLIPKIMYLLYASFACIMDVLQLFFRKLAGLDVYYVEGQPVSGDIITDFITGILGINSHGFTYSALSTTFWSFVVFGIIICVAATLVAVIKSHYNYDEKAAKGPMQYVYTAIKSVVNIVAVPVIVVLGLYVSQALLTAVDRITSVDTSTVISEFGSDVVNEYLVPCQTARSLDKLGGNSNEKTYIYYDIFGFGGTAPYGNLDIGSFGMGDINDMKKLALIGSVNQTFSGSLFRAAAYNASRARNNKWFDNKVPFTGADLESMGWHYMNVPIFKNAKDNAHLADLIDTAFACRLQTKSLFALNYVSGDSNFLAWVSPTYFTNFLCMFSNVFSKFNVGMIWYYYDLWQFNYVAGFGGIIVCLTIFLNVILGLITRLFMCIGLFLVAPPLFGLAPLDGGQAAKNWRENFMKQVLMTYGAVVGMNLVFLILPYINRIKFFNIGIADYLAQTLIIITGLITVKAMIATFSSIIGAADAQATGKEISKDVAGALAKGTMATVGAAKLGIKGNSAVSKGLANMYDSDKHPKLGKIFGGTLGGAARWEKRAGQLTKFVGKKLGGKIGGTRFGGFIKSHLPGAKTREAAARKKEFDDYENKNEWFDSFEGMTTADARNMNSEAMQAARIRLQQHGYNEQDIDRMMGRVQVTANGATGPQLTAGDVGLMKYGYGAGSSKEARSFDRMHTQYQGLRDDAHRAAFRRASGHAATIYGERLKRSNALKATLFTPVGIAKDLARENDFLKDFMDKSFLPPVDQAKRTADLVEAQNDQIKKLQKEIDEIKSNTDRIT